MKASDYEKLGAFYLGRSLDPATGTRGKTPLLLDSRDLTTHAAIIGMTGSGKTGLFIDLIEEAAIDKVPAICIDPKGDLANLMLTFPELRPKDFAPWVDAQEADRKGLSQDAYAAEVADLWKKGLAEWGQPKARIRSFRNAVDLGLYTPKSRAATPLAVLSSLKAPPPAIQADPELLGERADASIDGLLTLLGESGGELDRSRSFLGALLLHAWQKGQSVSLGDLIRLVTEPPMARIGVLDIDTFYGPKERQALALKLNAPLARPGFSAWLEGEPLDIQRLLYREDGTPRVSVLSIAHLNDRERMFFVTMLLTELISWMRQQPGTGSLRALLAMDEVFGFLPPVEEPPAKRLFLTLLKQARAYGVGLVLATQNPVDVDYKALSNAGTWLLGRLQTEQDVDRVLDGLLKSQGGSEVSPAAVQKTLSTLPKRTFLMNSVHEAKSVCFETRWAMSYLRGPLTRDQLSLLAHGPQGSQTASTSPAAATAKPKETDDGSATRPLLTGDLEEVFLGHPVGESAYRPALLAEVDVHHVRASSHIDHWSKLWALVPLDGASVKKDIFAKATALPEAPTLHKTPAEGARFLPLPAGTDASKNLRSYPASVKRFVYQHARLTLGRCKKPKAVAQPGESFDAFVARVQVLHREARDKAVAKVRTRYQKRLATAEGKVDKAIARVERETGQARQAQLTTAIGIGTTVLGAIFGSRSSGIRGAATATRRAGRAFEQQGDVKRAQEALQRAEEALGELQEEAQEALQLAGDLPDPAIDKMELAPKKSDLVVRQVQLAWCGDGILA